MLALRKIVPKTKAAMRTNHVLSVADIGRELAVTPDTVRVWIMNGQLRAFRCGRITRIRRRWLDDFIRQATWPPLEPGEVMPAGVGARGG